MSNGTEEFVFSHIVSGKIKLAARRQEREEQERADESAKAKHAACYLEAARDLVVNELALPPELRESVTVEERQSREYGTDHYAVLSVAGCAPIFVEFALRDGLPGRLLKTNWAIARPLRQSGYDEYYATYDWTYYSLDTTTDIDLALAIAAENYIEFKRIEKEIADENAARSVRAQSNPVAKPTIAEQLVDLLNQIIDERVVPQ